MMYVIMECYQHWFSQWLVAWWHQVITWSNAYFLPIQPFKTSFNGVLMKIQSFHSRKCSWKCLQIGDHLFRLHSIKHIMNNWCSRGLFVCVIQLEWHQERQAAYILVVGDWIVRMMESPERTVIEDWELSWCQIFINGGTAGYDNIFQCPTILCRNNKGVYFL